MATKTSDDAKQAETKKDFDEVVNMSASQIEAWLKTDESKSVGQIKDGDSESIGHQMGKHIIDILKKKEGQLTDADYEHMAKVVSYVRRHSAQRPKEVEGSNWEYSLKNWGHDPGKE